MISHELQSIINLIKVKDDDNLKLAILLLQGNIELAEEFILFFDDLMIYDRWVKFIHFVKVVAERLQRLMDWTIEMCESKIQDYLRYSQYIDNSKDIHRFQRRIEYIKKYKPFL